MNYFKKFRSRIKETNRKNEQLKKCRSRITETNRKNEQLKKYPLAFTGTENRLQINLNRMHLSPDDLNFEWLKNICKTINVKSLRYFRKRTFRIEKINDEIVYKLCLSSQCKNSSAYGVQMIIHFNKSKAYICNYEAIVRDAMETIKININDSYLALQNIFDILKTNQVDYHII